MNKNVPFYANTPGGTRCFQAALRMILKYFWPDRDFSWEEMDKITAKAEGYWTWPAAGLIWLVDQGIEVKNIEAFDSERFIKEGEKYLLEEFGEEVAELQIKHTKSIQQEQEFTKEFLEKVGVKKTIPAIQDIKRFLEDGCLVMCNVNSRILNKREGFSGHFVVVKGLDDKQFFLHDPGLPPQENRSVDFDTFEKAWAYPNDRAKNITAFKPK